MDRKSVLRELSATELREELLARLREQLRRCEEEAERLRGEIRQFMPSNGTAITRVPQRERKTKRLIARNEQPLREAIAHVLREAGEPQRIRDVVDAVKRAGYVSHASNFRNVVAISLSSNTGMFEKVGRGQYRVREDANELALAGAE